MRLLIIIFTMTITFIQPIYALKTIWSNISTVGICGMSIAVDSSSNVFITGFHNSGYFITVKYNKTGQAQRTNYYQWQSATSQWDIGTGIIIDNNNVYVAGAAINDSFTTNKYILIKYNSNLNAIRTNYYFYNSLTYPLSRSMDIKYDVYNNNIYITGVDLDNGFTPIRFKTIKYATNGNALWTNSITALNSDESFDWQSGMGIDIDSSGNIYIAGQRNSSFFVAKINSSGVLQWGYDYQSDFATDIAVGNNCFYVVGQNNSDFFTIKCDLNGNQIWTNRMNLGAVDKALGVAVDSNNNCYVTGHGSVSGSDRIVTVKYSSNSTPVWTNIGGSGSGSYIRGNDIKLDGAGKIYITGHYNNVVYTAKLGQPPMSATGLTGQALAGSTDRIVWTWQDRAIFESGYQLVNNQSSAVILNRPQNTTICTQTGLSANTARTCLVRATNAYGKVDSNIDVAYTRANPPTSLVSVYTTSGAIGLQWNGNGGTTFQLQRSTNDINYANAVSNRQTTSYTDIGLQSQKSYYYRVRGFNGDTIPTDWFTNQNSITTKQIIFDISFGAQNPSVKDIGKSDLNVEMLQVKFQVGSEGVIITNMTIRASGTGNEASDISKLYVYQDTDLDGIITGADIKIKEITNPFSSDNQLLSFSVTSSNTILAGTNESWLFGYDFSGSATNLDTFIVKLTNVKAIGSVSSNIMNPAGLPLTGNTMTVRVGSVNVYDPVVDFIQLVNTQDVNYYSGDITIQFKITDQDTSLLNGTIEYKSDILGIAWKPATLSSSLNNITSGTTNSVVWKSSTDLSGKVANDVMIRLTPSDGERTGQAKETSTFRLNNVILEDKNDIRVVNSYHDMSQSDSTEIMFQNTESGEVTITIYNLNGRKIWELKKDLPPSFHSINWNFKDQSGAVVSSGVYVIWVKGGGIDKYIKMSVYR